MIIFWHILPYRLACGLNLLAFICLWMMWIFAYMHQMNEILQGTLKDDIIDKIKDGTYKG